jgi:hypothetical protein
MRHHAARVPIQRSAASGRRKKAEGRAPVRHFPRQAARVGTTVPDARDCPRRPPPRLPACQARDSNGRSIFVSLRHPGSELKPVAGRFEPRALAWHVRTESALRGASAGSAPAECQEGTRCAPSGCGINESRMPGAGGGAMRMLRALRSWLVQCPAVFGGLLLIRTKQRLTGVVGSCQELVRARLTARSRDPARVRPTTVIHIRANIVIPIPLRARPRPAA